MALETERGSTASPTPQGNPTTPAAVTTPNSITKVTSSNTEATTALVVAKITAPGQVEEVFKAVTDANITVTFETASTALNVVDNLTQQSSGQLNKEDIDSIKGTLSAVSSQAASTKETAQTFLDIVKTILVPNDTLTDPDTVSSENSTSAKKHASSIMELLESFASDAAKNLLSPAKKKVVIQNDELVLQLTKISPEDTANITEPVIVSVNSSMNELHFPPAVFRGRNVTISAVVFNNLHLTSSSQLGGLHGNDTPTSVGSKIMSIQVEATDGSEVTFSANDPIELVLELNEDANTTNTQSLCVFWEFLEDEESGGVWSTVGCYRNQTNGSQITCRCDHLTNFAILLQVNPNPVVLSLAHRVTLDMLTYIGLALSIAALVCSLSTFVLLK
ncbi:adhesion G protein-coupled receptor L1-like [Strongylocentrotus purpuratus]|uniref:GAIN-B domain-containing protein n=1 Tax=Strongylocentrotus purpuratus TaxID=7668 RepID=A0A7M7NJU1_STRPU|nr:adhesion G protein-coupled receptor L1-like [Strongylocentrotus purpuratus]